MEYEGNIHDLYELNKYIFDEIHSRINNFKITMDQFDELKDNYLSNISIKKERNKEILSEMNKKSKFELFSSNGYECTGVLEFYFNREYLTTCTVISKKAVLMELKKEDLSKIFKNEAEILSSFYKLIFIKLVSLIKRLHYLKKNSICQMKDKFKENTNDNYYKNESNINSTKTKDVNNFHKKRFEFLNPVKIKKIYHEKKNVFDNHNKKNFINNPFTVANKSLMQIKNNNFSTKTFSSLHQIYHNNSQKLFKILNNSKSISSKNKKELFNSTRNLTKKDLILSDPKYKYLSPNSFSKNNNTKKIILYKKNNGNTPIEKNKIKSEIILTKKGYISIYNIKKNILKRNEEDKTLDNFKFINRLIYSYDAEKSFQDENSCKLTKNNKNNNIIKFDRITIKRNDRIDLNMSKEVLDNNIIRTYDFPNKISKSSQSSRTKDAFTFNNSKTNKKIENSFAKKENSNFSISCFPSIKKRNKKILNLIGEMKKKYAISLGKKKFIYYRSPKKNKVINLVDEKKDFTSIKKSIGQTIKEYYLRKKIEGYSSLINPLNNTYINRQRTYKIYKS